MLKTAAAAVRGRRATVNWPEYGPIWLIGPVGLNWQAGARVGAVVGLCVALLCPRPDLAGGGWTVAGRWAGSVGELTEPTRFPIPQGGHGWKRFPGLSELSHPRKGVRRRDARGDT